MQAKHDFPSLALDAEPSALARLKTLRRPRLLMRATACGLGDYRRLTFTKRLGLTGLSKPQIIAKLFALEDQCEGARRARLAHYRASRHLEVLIALCAEIAAFAQSDKTPAFPPNP